MEQIADPKIIVLVAEYNHDVIGFAVADPQAGELRAIYVKPNPVGHVGRALLFQVEERAFRTAEALTCVAALSAVEFYRANGYTEQGNTDYLDRSGTSIPCMRMKKVR